MTEPLFDLPPEPRPLTDRQRWIYGLIVAAGEEGITSDELGAHMHERWGKHSAGERCEFCSRDGSHALREAAISERLVKKGRSAFVALETRSSAPAAAPVSDAQGKSDAGWEAFVEATGGRMQDAA